MPKSLAARLSLIVCGVLAVAVLAAAAWFYLAPRPEGPPVAIGGPFNLVDQHGRQVSAADLHGQYLLVYFGYTFCPDVCPTELQAMGQAIDSLGEAGEAVTPVFITIDPERDTVEQLAAYAEHFHPRLVALTGTPEQIKAAAQAYRVYYGKAEDAGSTEYLMDHSSFVYLMSPEGKFLTHFSFGTSADKMAERMAAYL